MSLSKKIRSHLRCSWPSAFPVSLPDVALREPDLAADVVNYGYLARDPNAWNLKKIHASIPPVARRTTASLLTTFTKFVPQMTELGKDIENPDASVDAWSKTIPFLAATRKFEYPGASRIGTKFSGG